MGWEVLSLSRGFSLDLTGVAPTILRHEGRRPLPPPTYAGAVCWKGDAISGPTVKRCYSTEFSHGPPGYSTAFFQGEEPSRFPGLPLTGGAKSLPGALHTNSNSPTKKENEDTKAKNCGNWVAMLHWPSPPPEGLGYMDANRAKRMKD